jgi:flagellar biosynthetic protein FliR
MSTLAATAAGFGLVLTRTGALVLSAPVLGQGTGFAGYRVGLIFFLAFLLYWTVGAPVSEAHPLALGAMALREVLIGIFLGLLLQFVRSRCVAGELVSQEMASAKKARSIRRVASAATCHEPPENVFLLVLLALNGHHWLLRPESSFAMAPIGHVTLGPRPAPTLEALRRLSALDRSPRR